MEEMRRRQRRMVASTEGGQGPVGAVVPKIEWNGKMEETVGVLLPSHVPHETEEHSVRIASLLEKNFRGTSWI